jgi:hypothetical protein
MVIYTLFSSNQGHIWGPVGLSWCKTRPTIGHVGTKPNGGFFRLVDHYFNYSMCILILISSIRFTGCHTSYSASIGRNSPRFGVRTKELWPSNAWGIKSNLIAITGVLAQNWFKTARLLRTDDSMVIYTLFSSNLGHIWGTVGLSWCKMRPIIGHMGTGPNGGFFGLVGHYFNYSMCIPVLISWIRFSGHHTGYSASNGRNSPRFRVRTKELWPSDAGGIKSNLIAVTGVLAQNWFKTARLLHTDDSMVIYMLFSSILGHIWGTVGLSWCKIRPIIDHIGTEPNGGFFRLVRHYFNYSMCILVLIS